MNQSARQHALIRTLSFFDLFSHPLTAEELCNYAWTPPAAPRSDFKQLLAGPLPGNINTKNGYFFLAGRDQIIEQRRARTAAVDNKIRRARRLSGGLRHIPFIRAIFVCNSVAFETASAESDIDFFIVTAPNRIWLVRFFTNLILKLLGARVGKRHAANKICLSFYVDTRHLDLSGLRAFPDDIYLVYWLQTLLPVYDPENWQVKIMAANSWVRKYVPFAPAPLPAPAGPPASRWRRFWEACWQGSYGDLIEREAERIQQHKLARGLVTAASAAGSNGVVIAPGILKFHEHDARPGLRAAWLERCKEI